MYLAITTPHGNIYTRCSAVGQPEGTPSPSFFGKSRFDIFEKYWILMPSHPVFEFSDWAELPPPPKLTHHALSNKAKPNESFDGGGCHSEGRGDI